MDHGIPDMGDLEGEVMQLVWARGPLTADAVREQLARRLTDSTIRTVLRRLEAKGYVSHAIEGRAFLYRAAVPRRTVAAKAVKRIVDWFCNGSTEELLLGMVDHAMLDRRQLRMLAGRIERAKVEKAKVGQAKIERAERTSNRSKRGKT